MGRPKEPWLNKVDRHLAAGSWDKTWASMQRLMVGVLDGVGRTATTLPVGVLDGSSVGRTATTLPVGADRAAATLPVGIGMDRAAATLPVYATTPAE